MEETYPGHGIVSGKNRKLFEVWDAAYPVTAPECSKAYLVVENGGNANRFQETKCREAGIWKR